MSALRASTGRWHSESCNARLLLGTLCSRPARETGSSEASSLSLRQVPLQHDACIQSTHTVNMRGSPTHTPVHAPHARTTDTRSHGPWVSEAIAVLSRVPVLLTAMVHKEDAFAQQADDALIMVLTLGSQMTPEAARTGCRPKMSRQSSGTRAGCALTSTCRRRHDLCNIDSSCSTIRAA
jgi:hypothetical protein